MYPSIRVSTAKVEGINNHIKVFKCRAYGYRDLDYFMLENIPFPLIREGKISILRHRFYYLILINLDYS